MANFVIKEGRQRIPDLDRDPNRKHAERAAHANIPNLKFQSVAQERDYRKQISLNSRNIYGAPEFFPPEEIKSFVSGLPDLTEEEQRQIDEDKINRKCSGVIPLRCPNCVPLSHRQRPDENGVTPHWISADICKCQLCGAEKPYRTQFRFEFIMPTRRNRATSTTPQGN